MSPLQTQVAVAAPTQPTQGPTTPWTHSEMLWSKGSPSPFSPSTRTSLQT